MNVSMNSGDKHDEWTLIHWHIVLLSLSSPSSSSSSLSIQLSPCVCMCVPLLRILQFDIEIDDVMWLQITWLYQNSLASTSKSVIHSFIAFSFGGYYTRTGMLGRAAHFVLCMCARRFFFSSFFVNLFLSKSYFASDINHRCQRE